MPRKLTRRAVLRRTSLAAGAFWAGRIARSEDKSPNEKLDVACIGIGGRGAANLKGVADAQENIVALCDVHQRRGAESFAAFPEAKRYVDFRKMLDELDSQIDAVVVSTPDHTHAAAAAMAMHLGKHCYCEKPLTHHLAETRALRKLAAEKKVATQLGTQIHAGDNYRRVVEWIRSGAIGPVREVYCFMGRKTANGRGRSRPEDSPPAPEGFDWDLWLGPAPHRPHHPCYYPGAWRGWWAFGNGTMGDYGCHYIDLPFWALGLRYPTTVEASGSEPHPETPAWSIRADWQFEARGDQPPVRLTWLSGHDLPPVLEQEGLDKPPYAITFVGDEGILMAHYGWHKLFPKEKFADVKPPEPTIPRSVGHHKEWLDACRTGEPTTCDFDYSGALTETVLLGNVAFRTGQKLQWDAENLRATNCPEADRYIQREYRQGWTL